MPTTLEEHLAARAAHQAAVAAKMSEACALIRQGQLDGLYPDGLTAPLHQALLLNDNLVAQLSPPSPPAEPDA